MYFLLKLVTVAGQNLGHPFDLSDHQHERDQGNLLTDEYFHQYHKNLHDKSVIIYVLTIHTNITNFGAGNDRASQDEQDALPALFDDAVVHNVCHPFDLNHPQ